jgi:hypothetical protein
MRKIRFTSVRTLKRDSGKKGKVKKIRAGTDAENLGPTLRKELFSEMRVLV